MRSLGFIAHNVYRQTNFLLYLTQFKCIKATRHSQLSGFVDFNKNFQKATESRHDPGIMMQDSCLINILT